jgi:hypothetical protein
VLNETGDKSVKLEQVYLLTMSLLIFHQIDAAYWKEWEMFYLPGGIQGFLLFNIVIIPIILVGYKRLITRSSHANLYSYLCAGLAILTFVIHTGFALLGSMQFDLPLSMAIIVLCLMSGVWQMILTKRAEHRLT